MKKRKKQKRRGQPRTPQGRAALDLRAKLTFRKLGIRFGELSNRKKYSQLSYTKQKKEKMYTRTKNRKPKKKQKNKNKAAKKAKKSPERSEGLEGSRRKKENNGATPKPSQSPGQQSRTKLRFAGAAREKITKLSEKSIKRYAKIGDARADGREPAACKKNKKNTKIRANFGNIQHIRSSIREYKKKNDKGDLNMAYKTPEQMLQIILNEGLLTDACMTILEGRNPYGFHAAEIPSGSVKKLADGAYTITVTSDGGDVHIPVHVKDSKKETSFWLIKLENGKPYSVFAIQHDAGTDEKKVKQKEYLSCLTLFLDYHKIRTNTQLMAVLKDGFSRLKKELHDEGNPYELLRDYLSDETVAMRTARMPKKFGLRLDFHWKGEDGKAG